MAHMVYELAFKGSATPALRALFPEFEAVPNRGVTVLRGVFADQAALRGAMTRIRGLGLELLEVRRVAEGEAGEGGPEADARR